MWTSRNRARYDRSKLRYPSDVTDEEWELMVPLIPPGKSGGGKRTVIMREVVNGLMYVLSTGCQWRAIPKDLPPKSTVYDYFDLWTYDGTLQRIHRRHRRVLRCSSTGRVYAALGRLSLGYERRAPAERWLARASERSPARRAQCSATKCARINLRTCMR